MWALSLLSRREQLFGERGMRYLFTFLTLFLINYQSSALAAGNDDVAYELEVEELQIDTAIKENQDKIKEVATTQQEKKRLESNIAGLQARKEQVQKRLQITRDQLAKETARLHQLENNNQRLQKEHDSVQSKFEKIKSQASATAEKRKSAEQKNRELDREVRSLNGKVSQLERAVNNNNNKIKQLSERMNKAQSMKRDLKRRANRADATVNQQNLRIAQLRTRLANVARK